VSVLDDLRQVKPWVDSPASRTLGTPLTSLTAAHVTRAPFGSFESSGRKIDCGSFDFSFLVVASLAYAFFFSRLLPLVTISPLGCGGTTTQLDLETTFWSCTVAFVSTFVLNGLNKQLPCPPVCPTGLVDRTLPRSGDLTPISPLSNGCFIAVLHCAPEPGASTAQSFQSTFEVSLPARTPRANDQKP
jgi:hypothetical protein